MKSTKGFKGILGLVGMLALVVGCQVVDSVKEKVSSKPARNIASVTFDKNTYPAVVLGGGVGGMTASVYLAMANMKTLLVQGQMPGGLLTVAFVRNWPAEIESPGAALPISLRRRRSSVA